MNDKRKTMAQTNYNIFVFCPYCGNRFDIKKELHNQEYYDVRYKEGSISCDVECKYCEKDFIVTGIDF